MDIPKKCPGHDDSIFLVLTVIRITLSCIILWFFNIIIMISYLIFTLLFNGIILNKYLCKICIYKIEQEFESIEEYHEKYGQKFLGRMKKVFPLLLIDWFLPFILGIFAVILLWNELSVLTEEEMTLFHFVNVFVLLASMIFQILINQMAIRRTPKYHCKKCLYKEYCPVSTNYKNRNNGKRQPAR